MQSTVTHLTHGVIHTVMDSQKQAFSNHVNAVLENDKDIGHFLPISSKNIFDAVQDGIILCKLINKAVPGRVPPISPEAINIHPTNMYHKIENLNLAIESARSIGCVVINLQPQFIMEKRQHIVLGLIWQIIRIHIGNQLTLKQYPELILLKKPDEEDDVMLKLGYEEILIRWINYHIAKNGGDKKVTNLGKDLIDGYGYGHVLQNVSNHFDKTYWDKDQQTRSQLIIQTCNKDGIKTSVQAKDILSGNPRLNAILLAEIFNDRHGLVLPKESVIEVPAEPETDESREIRVFKNWINSQGIEDVFVNYLMTDLKDGRILLKVIDRLRPGTVDWNKYSNKLHSRIHIVQNCNFAVDICKDKLGLKIIGIGGIDIVDGKVSLTLGVVWQLCKLYLEERVGKISEEQLIEWGNSKVPAEYQVKNIKDKSIRNCQFLLNIIQKIRPGTVDFTKVRSGDSQEEQISKINYTIAAARKLGCEVLTLWQHVNEVNARFVSLLLAELQYKQKNPHSKVEELK